jgi:NDP-sugar pyrophosphorylase family protein
MPIANVPILHYVIEFLVMNQVKEIVIATGTHRKEIL